MSLTATPFAGKGRATLANPKAHITDRWLAPPRVVT
jgi:hypothetical protein